MIGSEVRGSTITEARGEVAIPAWKTSILTRESPKAPNQVPEVLTGTAHRAFRTLLSGVADELVLGEGDVGDWSWPQPPSSMAGQRTTASRETVVRPQRPVPIVFSRVVTP